MATTMQNREKYGVTVEDVLPGTPEWEESERALGYAPFVPAWRRRELERAARGESAGKDLGVADEEPMVDLEQMDADRLRLLEASDEDGRHVFETSSDRSFCKCGEHRDEGLHTFERRFSVASLEQAAGAVTAGDPAYRARVLAVAIEADVYIFGAAEILQAEERYAKTGLTIDAAKAVEVRRAVVERTEQEIDEGRCAVQGCTKGGRSQVCIYDGRYHHHGRIHYGPDYPEMAELEISFRKLEDGGWRGVCDEHYALLRDAREAASNARR